MKKTLARLIFFKLMGWTIKGEYPDIQKLIVAVVPHSSYFDFIVAVLTRTILNKRIKFLPAIIARYDSINAEKRGDIIADILSAEELTDQQKNGIKDQLRSILGEKLSLNYKIDHKIIGGLIVKVGSKMIDSSLNSKINKLTIAMKGA